MVTKTFQTNLNLVWNMRFAKSISFFPNQTGNRTQFLGVTFPNQTGFGLEKGTEWNVAAVRDEYRWCRTWDSSFPVLRTSCPALRSCHYWHCLYWPLHLPPSRYRCRLVHLVHGESERWWRDDLGPQVSDQVLIELALKLTQEETSEPHDDGRYQHYHFRPW